MNWYVYPGLNNQRMPKEMPKVLKIQMAKDIIALTADFYKVPLEKIYTKNRSGDLPKVVQVSTYLIYEKVGHLELKLVASLYGDRYLGKWGHDHSAINHNRKTMEGWVKVNDRGLKDDTDYLLTII
jgi:chromosomal replication initiation ATPase DnaA